jgi:hypothetical protein
MPRNCTEIIETMNSMEGVLNTPVDPIAYTWLAFAHILTVIIPACTTVAVAYNLIARLTDHPSKVIFKWICVLSLVSPCTYATLMDLSLILDKPIIGRCEENWEGAIYWLVHSTFQTTLLWIFALNPVMIYITTWRRTTHFSKKKLNCILLGILILAFLESCLWVFLTEFHVEKSCRVRGSFCVVLFKSPPEVVVALEDLRILVAVTPALVSVPLFVSLYYCKVRESVRFNPALFNSILNVSIALITGAFLWNVPTMLFHLSTYHGYQRTFVSLVTTYTIQLNFVLYPLLIILLHKDLRKKVVEMFWRMLRREGVHPTSDPSEVPMQAFQRRTRRARARRPRNRQRPQPQPQPCRQLQLQEPHPQGDQQPHPYGDQQPHPQEDQQPRPQEDQQPYRQEDQQPRPQGDQQPHPQGDQQPRQQGDQQPLPQEDQQPRPQGDQQPHPQEDQQPLSQGDQQPRPQEDMLPHPQENMPHPQEEPPQGDLPQGDLQPHPQGNLPLKDPKNIDNREGK